MSEHREWKGVSLAAEDVNECHFVETHQKARSRGWYGGIYILIEVEQVECGKAGPLTWGVLRQRRRAALSQQHVIG